MQYQCTFCEEKNIQGIAIVIPGAQLSKASAIIGNLWKQYGQTVFDTPSQAAMLPCYGLYTDYQPDGGYTVIVGSQQQGTNTKAYTIPSGNYAVFTIYGDVKKSVSEAWEHINTLPLDRSFICDFEEYAGGEDPQHMEIKIYVGLR